MFRHLLFNKGYTPRYASLNEGGQPSGKSGPEDQLSEQVQVSREKVSDLAEVTMRKINR